jgi:aryl-alcohol dehydrogenase-like predicted oxidoreductase
MDRPRINGSPRFMQQHQFGRLWPVSALTLGGGGLGMLWGETTFAECVTTVEMALEARINLIDLAPHYGDGKAEEVVGAALGGKLAAGRERPASAISANCRAPKIEPLLRRSTDGSLHRLRLDRLDLFFLHSNVVPDSDHIAERPGAAERMAT